MSWNSVFFLGHAPSSDLTYVLYLFTGDLGNKSTNTLLRFLVQILNIRTVKIS
jgi:hypothetical protein